MKYLLFPLGNSDKKYKETRHNAGRFVIDLLKKDENFNNILIKYDIDIFLPDCYMNESGEYLKKSYPPTPFQRKGEKMQECIKNIIVVYDDKDLEIGRIKISFGNSDGGHNGVKNIIENFNTKDFWRIRIGIAPKGTGKDNLIPPHGDIVREYVLGKFKAEEKEILSDKNFLERILILLENILNTK